MSTFLPRTEQAWAEQANPIFLERLLMCDAKHGTGLGLQVGPVSTVNVGVDANHGRGLVLQVNHIYTANVVYVLA